MKSFFVSAILLVFLFLTGCSISGGNTDPVYQTGSGSLQMEIPGSISKSISKSIASQQVNNGINNGAILKNSILDAVNIMISIEDSSGNKVYDKKQLLIYKFGLNFMTQPLTFKTGTYKVTEFLILDTSGKVIFATPLSGSPKAYLVQKPLPIEFSIEKDKTTKVFPEILDAEDIQPADFGYTTFSFKINTTLSFLLNVFTYDESVSNFTMTDASIDISSGNDIVYKGSVTASLNQIVIVDSYSEYVVKITKNGTATFDYKPYSETLTKEKLKEFIESPMSVTLVTIAKSYTDPGTNTPHYYGVLKDDKISEITTSAELSKEESSAILAGLNISSSTLLPLSIDLSSKFPQPGDQGAQGSCVGFATAYACKTYQEGIEEKWNVNDISHQFSPSWIYNQLNGGLNNGIMVSSALDLIVSSGCDTLDNFPYNQDNYTRQPDNNSLIRSKKYKGSYWYVLPNDLIMLKTLLASGNAIVASTDVYPDFDTISIDNQVFDVASGNKSGSHAICLIGYDDGKNAFKFINSWGKDRGIDGYGWISYDFVKSKSPVNFIAYTIIDGSNIISDISSQVASLQNKISWITTTFDKMISDTESDLNNLEKNYPFEFQITAKKEEINQASALFDNEINRRKDAINQLGNACPITLQMISNKRAEKGPINQLFNDQINVLKDQQNHLGDACPITLQMISNKRAEKGPIAQGYNDQINLRRDQINRIGDACPNNAAISSLKDQISYYESHKPPYYDPIYEANLSSLKSSLSRAESDKSRWIADASSELQNQINVLESQRNAATQEIENQAVTLENQRAAWINDGSNNLQQMINKLESDKSAATQEIENQALQLERDRSSWISNSTSIINSEIALIENDKSKAINELNNQLNALIYVKNKSISDMTKLLTDKINYLKEEKAREIGAIQSQIDYLIG